MQYAVKTLTICLLLSAYCILNIFCEFCGLLNALVGLIKGGRYGQTEASKNVHEYQEKV